MLLYIYQSSTRKKKNL